MITVMNNLINESPALLPPREKPYLLQDVYELVKDNCRSELVLDLSGSYLQFRADEDNDSIYFDFQSREFDPSRDHCSLSSDKKLVPSETAILKALTGGPKTKKQMLALGLQATAKILGAGSKKGFGRQGGGLLRPGLIKPTGKSFRGSIQYQITATGRKALMASELMGKELGWTWAATNQQGYCDSVMMSFEGIIPTVLLHVIASSIEVFTITSG
jgi:hypothetical protein